MGKALVLGAGSPPGAFWEAGLIEGFREAGTDLRTADLIVGTSAGAVVGALIAHGADVIAVIEDIIGASRKLAESGTQDMSERLLRAYDVMSVTSLPVPERRKHLGRLARGIDTGRNAERLDLFIDRLPSARWPERDLLIPCLDAETGERVVWRRGGAATLPEAVRAACSMPMVYPPVEIAGRAYMSAPVYSTTNADLAAGSRRVVVLAPRGNVLSATAIDDELASAGPDRAAVIGPNTETEEVFAFGVFDPSTGTAALHAGHQQAVMETGQAEQVAEVWGD
ncbi:Patatin-like phospholipase [Actinomadura rubteroloni]|uniref:Patatin-like phospholipase n=1 Tax=Actinomadura rubteroloni TaxID=1926885 RepID=A0A2P4UE38_9ACTN|nr:patatin-like phospholipase family protein [Actinomadura rubteroloni]POM23315.1 Patatin-like phospholipase [Actinomadura rubteroloni]